MLSATWGSYEVEPVAVGPDGAYSLGTFHIRHPTAREAICIIENAEAGEDGWYAVKNALRSWLPFRLYSILVSERMSRRGALKIASALLSVGIPEAEKAAHEKRKKKAEARWGEMIAMYRHLYPMGSLDEPFPFWLSQLMEMDRVRSRDTIEHFTAAALAQTGSKDGIAALQRRAGHEEEYDEEEALRRQKASLERLKGLHHQVVKGKRIGSA